MYSVCTFSTSDKFFVFVSNDCPLVKMGPYCFNPNLAPNLWAPVVLQTMTTVVANYLLMKTLFGYFFG